ncbi:MAG: AAA family ATPase [Clostridiaceae bacterium]
MKEELKYKELNFNFKCYPYFENELINTKELDCLYEKIENVTKTKLSNFGIYIVDDNYNFSINKLKLFIEKSYANKKSPLDICYFSNSKQEKIKYMKLETGKGNLLKKINETIKNEYENLLLDFYNNNQEKEDVLDSLITIKDDEIDKLIIEANKYEFEVIQKENGFTFVPLMDGEKMNENQYNNLSREKKSIIIDNVKHLKYLSDNIISKIEISEDEGLIKFKSIFNKYILEKTKDLKENHNELFKNQKKPLNYLNNLYKYIEDTLLSILTFNFEDIEESIKEMFSNYKINVLVDNENISHPRVIYEDDPNTNNLFGFIEYENINSNYYTDVSYIKEGSLLKADTGCLIVRLKDLLSYQSSYQKLIKSFRTGRIENEYTKKFLDILPIKNLEIEKIVINEQLILIGDLESYYVLKDLDKDFENLFKILIENNPYMEINEQNEKSFSNLIHREIMNYNLLDFSCDAIFEIAKYFSKKANDKNRLYLDIDELRKILNLSSGQSIIKGDSLVYKKSVLSVLNEGNYLEQEILKEYKNKKIIFDLSNKKIGQINGLSVIDTGIKEIGRPIKITCSISHGEGNIYDIQKESNLSGKIHSKSLGILKGYLNTLINPYENIPIDFHVCFEQIYSKIDGDSASVAEMLCILSAICNVPINQNLAVTGSINQFGVIQPVGGLNSKIEGFFNVCNTLEDVKDKGVLIPKSNKDELILNDEILESIRKGDFHIYTIESIEDAMDIMIYNDFYKSLKSIIKDEFKKYKSR